MAVQAMTHGIGTVGSLLRLAALAVLGFGCVVAAAAPPEAPADGKPLRIAFQKGSINLSIARQRGVLEKRFGPITWVEFPAGPQLLEALAVGSADLGAVGDTPPVFAQAAGKNLVYVGVEPPKPDASAILVPAKSPLRNLSELKGKRIAFQKGSSAHFLVVRALEKAGLTYKDIEPAYLAPAEARAAFERGAVDAWAVWDPYYAAAELQSGARALATGRGIVSNNSFYLATPAFLDRNAKFVLALLDELSANDAWIAAHTADAAALFAAFSGLDTKVAEVVLRRRPTSVIGPLTPAIVADQQRVADTYFALGLIPKPVIVGDLVWKPESSLLATHARSTP
jgi:sulfonate transport system substrate-binding protein